MRGECGQPLAAHSGRCAQGAGQVRGCNRRMGFRAARPAGASGGLRKCGRGRSALLRGRHSSRSLRRGARMWAALGCPLRTVCARSQPSAGMQSPGRLSRRSPCQGLSLRKAPAVRWVRGAKSPATPKAHSAAPHGLKALPADSPAGVEHRLAPDAAATGRRFVSCFPPPGSLPPSCLRASRYGGQVGGFVTRG